MFYASIFFEPILLLLKKLMEKFDLILVGTGFASSFFLRKYLEKSPLDNRVLVLERGIMCPYTERLKAAGGKQSDIFEKRVKTGDTFINDSEDKVWMFDPNFGGSSNCWTGCTPRFLPNDFKIKSLYGMGQDWPISYDEIEPYYTQAEEIMMIAGPEITPFPRSKPYPLPPQTLSSVDKLLQDKYKELYISQPTARATVPTGKRNACCTSAVCGLCPVNSKFTIENTLDYLYADKRVTIRYGSQVHHLLTENDTIKGVAYKYNGKDYEVNAEIVALGANAIFNAHILLNSGDTNPKTGKGLCEQRGTFAYLYFKDIDNVGGSSIITANGYMLYDGDHRKNEAACIIESSNIPFIRNEPGKWRKIARLKFVFEDLPDDNNKVVLSDNLLKPGVQYAKHTSYVDKAMKNLKGNIDKIFSFLPVEKIEMDGYFQKSEYHICSTVRMSDSKEEGVVDKNLIHHQYRNLFILGSGVYPSITPANPTLTLSALSLMAADKIF